MAKTVAEILKETGMTDEQIAALDPKVSAGLTAVVTTALTAQEKGEEALRLQRQQYDTDIAPALDKWGNDKASYDAKIAAYDAALKAAEEGGFKIPDLLKTQAAASSAATTRAADGKFVAGPTGSPEFVQKLRDDIGGAFSFLADTTWKYRKLYGQEMPDSPTAIIREAAANRMEPQAWAEKKYNFAAKEAEQAKAARQAEIDTAVKTEKAKWDKELAESGGNNPMVNRAQQSDFSKISSAVKANERPSPIGMTREERHKATQQSIQKEIAANAEVVH